MSIEPSQIAFAEVYRSHRSSVRAIVRKAGVSPDLVDDVTHEIFLRVFETGGLDRFDPTRPEKLRSYLSSFAHLQVRGHRERIQTHQWRSRPVAPEDFDHLSSGDGEIPENSAEVLLDRFLDATEGDAHLFIIKVSENDGYVSARAELVRLGWSKSRVTCAVVAARRAVRSCIPQ